MSIYCKKMRFSNNQVRFSWKSNKINLSSVLAQGNELILNFAFRQLAVPPQLFKVTTNERKIKTKP